MFGLHAQSLPFKSTQNLSQLAGEVFSTAWFHSEPPVVNSSITAGGVNTYNYPNSNARGNSSIHKNAEVANALKVAGTASRLAVQRNAVLAGTAGPNIANTAKKDKEKEGAPHIFRFSRYSTISNLPEMSSSKLEGGVFLALCRVLVVQQLTVNTSIEDADIMAGLQQGCDCVYSSMT